MPPLIRARRRATSSRELIGLPLRVPTELKAQLPRGPGETHLDRTFRCIKNLAHVSQRKTMEMLQVENHALTRGKSLQSSQDLRTQLPA